MGYPSASPGNRDTLPRRGRNSGMPVWKRVAGIIGGVLTTSPFWPYLKKVLEWGEHSEFIYHRAHDVEGAGPVLEKILSPPSWLPFILLPLGFFMLWIALRRSNKSRLDEAPTAAVQTTAIQPTADIDAREAFFQILEFSKWRKEQDRTTDPTQLVYDWREVRLSTAIHKALRNSHLQAWGEQNLPGFATTPEKPIPDDTWDTVEIEFDRSALPRTAARFRGRTRREPGPMAWIGVKFSRQQIFQLFPLENSDDYRPIFMAIQCIRERTGDTNAAKFWPATRLALRQAAYDKRLKVRGRKQLPENNPHTGGEYSDLFTDVDSSYWATSEINVLATEQDHQSDYHTDPQTAFAWGKQGIYERNRYVELKINWADILREWP